MTLGHVIASQYTPATSSSSDGQWKARSSASLNAVQASRSACNPSRSANAFSISLRSLSNSSGLVTSILNLFAMSAYLSLQLVLPWKNSSVSSLSMAFLRAFASSISVAFIS